VSGRAMFSGRPSSAVREMQATCGNGSCEAVGGECVRVCSRPGEQREAAYVLGGAMPSGRRSSAVREMKATRGERVCGGGKERGGNCVFVGEGGPHVCLAGRGTCERLRVSVDRVGERHLRSSNRGSMRSAPRQCWTR
jgi:hypothetical protein